MLPPAKESTDATVPVAGPQLTKEQLHVLQHSLGIDQYGQGEMYRNHFCAGGKDEDTCRELVAMGFMETFTRSYLPYYNCTVTEAGKAAVLAQSPRPPKLRRGQQRYRAYLKADTGFSFREWLQMQKTAKKHCFEDEANAGGKE